MAIVIIGETRCSICNLKLQESDAIHSIPPISDIFHSLYEFSDSAAHRDCYQSWDQKDRMLAAIEEEKTLFRESDYFRKMVKKFGSADWVDHQL